MGETFGKDKTLVRYQNAYQPSSVYIAQHGQR